MESEKLKQEKCINIALYVCLASLVLVEIVNLGVIGNPAGEQNKQFATFILLSSAVEGIAYLFFLVSGCISIHKLRRLSDGQEFSHAIRQVFTIIGVFLLAMITQYIFMVIVWRSSF